MSNGSSHISRNGPPCPLCDRAAQTWRPIHAHPMMKCTACDFVFAADRRVPAGLYESAYTSEGEYAGLLAGAQEQKQGRGSFDWMHQWVIDRVQPFGQRRMLDLGCGVGSALFLGQRAGWHAVGQDTSENAMRVAREVFGVETLGYPIEEIADRGKKFEFVTAFNLIEHVPAPRQYLRTLRRLVTDDGYLGVVVPNYDSYAMRHTTYAQWLPPYHLNFFTQSSLDAALLDAGFRIVQQSVRFASWSGVEGGTLRRIALTPYLITQAIIGRLRGNAILAVAKAV